MTVFRTNPKTSREPTSGNDLPNKEYTDTKSTSAVSEACNIFSEAFGEPTGIKDRAESQITFNAQTREMTISPTGESFTFYVKNTEFKYSTSVTVQWPDIEGGYIAMFDENGDLQIINRLYATSAIYTDYAMVASIYWNATDKKLEWQGELRHGHRMPGVTHMFLNKFICTQYGGVGLSLLVSPDEDGSSNEHCSIRYEGGVIVDEDMVINIPDQSTTMSGKIYYKSGIQSLWRTTDVTDVPLKMGTTYPVINTYDEENGWVLSETDKDDYFWVHAYATGSFESPVVFFMGINVYNKAKDACNELGTEINIVETDGHLIPGIKTIGSVLFKAGNFSNQYNAIIVSSVKDKETTDYIDTRRSRIVSNVAPNDHGLLAKLGSDHHSQYLNINGREGDQNVYGSIDNGSLILHSSTDTQNNKKLSISDSGISIGDSYTPPIASNEVAQKGYCDKRVISGSLGGTITITDENLVITNNCAAVILPDAQSCKQEIIIKCTNPVDCDYPNVSITPASGQSFFGHVSITISYNQTVRLVASGTTWYVV